MVLTNVFFFCLGVVEWMSWWTNLIPRMIGIPEGVDELLLCESCLVAHFWWTSSPLFQLCRLRFSFFTSFCWLGTGYWSLVLLWFKKIGWNENNGKSPYDCPLQLKWKKQYLFWHFSITSLRCRGGQKSYRTICDFFTVILCILHFQTKFFCTAFEGV